MEKGRHAERTKARLKRLTNPTEQSARKWRVSLPTQMSGDKSMLTRVSNSPAQFSEAPQPAWLEETREMRAANHLLQGQAITEPSVLNQIYQTASTIQLKELTIGRKIQSRSPSRNYCQERHEILEISRWISGKMDNLKQQQQFDLSIFIDYRQFVVNLALDRLLSIFRRYSVEAADLMTELWKKTFGFMEVLLTIFSKQHTQKELSIAKLEREHEELHVHYLAKLKQEQKQLIQNIEHLNGELKSTVLAGKQLKKKCSQLTRTIGDQKKQIKQLEEALIRSLHINMQCSSGEHLQWSYRVFNTLSRSYGRMPNPIPSGKQDPSRTQAAVLAAYRNVGSAYESSERRTFEDRFEDDEEGRWEDQLSVTRILEMAAPRDVSCSTADLYEIQDVGIQCVPQQQHQSSNTPHNPKCQVGLQVRLPMKQYGVQTRQASRDSSAHLLKNRFNGGGFSRTSQASHAFPQSIPSRPPSMGNYSQLLSTEPEEKGSPFHNSRLTNSIITNKIRLNNRAANMTIIHPEVDEANSYDSSEEEETGTDQRNLELNLDLNFGEVYTNNKRSLLQNEAGFKRRITKQRSFYQSPRLYKPVHLSSGVPYVDSSIRKHHKHEVWIQDILPKQRIWQQVLRDAKHKLISPASVQMATGSLFRMFSQIIQTLCRAEKFGGVKQQTKSLRTQRPRRLQALKYIVMRRLNDIIRTQFERELRQLTNNLLFLRRTKELQMFSMLMGLSEGYAEVGANQLELYVRAFALLDSSQKFQVEKDARTTSFLLCDKFQQITQGYFEQDERERLLQKLLKADCSHLMIDEVARTLVKKYTEKKRLSYDSYEYLFECSMHFGFAQMKCLIRHFNISHRTKSIMLREFGRLMDCSNSKGRYISYERFWTFCERVNFPSRSALMEFFRKESIQQQVVEYCSEIPEKTVDLLADHHLRIPPLLTEILKFLRRSPQPTKVEFWTLFLLAFSSQEILQQKASRLFPEQFQLLLEAGYPRQ